jgi:hypothetical protein
MGQLASLIYCPIPRHGMGQRHMALAARWACARGEGAFRWEAVTLPLHSHRTPARPDGAIGATEYSVGVWTVMLTPRRAVLSV